MRLRSKCGDPEPPICTSRGAVSPGHRGVQMGLSALAPMSDPGRVGSAGGRVRCRAGAGIID
jgi:hypothetical protein